MKNVLETLAVPMPPYRMPRPVTAVLAVAETPTPPVEAATEKPRALEAQNIAERAELVRQEVMSAKLPENATSEQQAALAKLREDFMGRVSALMGDAEITRPPQRAAPVIVPVPSAAPPKKPSAPVRHASTKETGKKLGTLQEERESLLRARGTMSEKEFARRLQEYDVAIAEAPAPKEVGSETIYIKRKKQPEPAKPPPGDTVPVPENTRPPQDVVPAPTFEFNRKPAPWITREQIAELREAYEKTKKEEDEKKAAAEKELEAAKKESGHPGDFYESLERPALREAPKLDTLAAVQGFIEFARRTGRSPEFIRGLEEMRRSYAQNAEKPRPEPGSERVYIRPGSPEGNAIAAARSATEQEGLSSEGTPEARRQELSTSVQEQEVQLEEEGPATRALEELGGDDIEMLGDSAEPGWWERVGISLEGSMHDFLAWYSGVLAKRAKDNLAERVKKRKRMEDAAKRLADASWLGAVASPFRYGPRVQYQRWREGLTRAALERNDDNRAWHENARNELIHLAADRFDVPLKTHEARAEKYAEKSERYENDLEIQRAAIEKWRRFFVTTNDFREKEAVRRRIDALREKYDEVVKEKEGVERLWQNENKHAIRIQRIKNQLLKAASPADRPNTEHEPRVKEGGRPKRRKPISAGEFRNIKRPGTEEDVAA